MLMAKSGRSETLGGNASPGSLMRDLYIASQEANHKIEPLHTATLCMYSFASLFACYMVYAVMLMRRH